MIIEPKPLSTAALNAIIMDFDESAPARSPRAFTQCLLEHVTALQAALDLERKYRAEDRAEAMGTYDTMTAELAAQAVLIGVLEKRADTIEAATITRIGVWLRDRQERPDLALLVEAGTWKVAT